MACTYLASHSYEGLMQDAEMKRIIKSSFQPYHCGVEFLPLNDTQKIWVGIRVSNEDDSLIFQAQSGLKAVREDLDQHITWWREGATNKGFKLEPL